MYSYCSRPIDLKTYQISKKLIHLNLLQDLPLLPICIILRTYYDNVENYLKLSLQITIKIQFHSNLNIKRWILNFLVHSSFISTRTLKPTELAAEPSKIDNFIWNFFVWSLKSISAISSKKNIVIEGKRDYNLDLFISVSDVTG